MDTGHNTKLTKTCMVRGTISHEGYGGRSALPVAGSGYAFRAIGVSWLLARLFHPWKGEKSPAFHASRSPGLLRSQSGRISLVTTRKSCQRSTTEGRPQNQ